ncbi:hypothetical protein MRB53_037044 [Persea americana]|nr:hypothetical protein MRB53_037044 [Persea americana]
MLDAILITFWRRIACRTTTSRRNLSPPLARSRVVGSTTSRQDCLNAQHCDRSTSVRARSLYLCDIVEAWTDPSPIELSAAVTKRAGRKTAGTAVQPGAGGGKPQVKKAVFESTKKREVGVSDLTLISKISNEAINDNLKKRFENGEIYVCKDAQTMRSADRAQDVHRPRAGICQSFSRSWVSRPRL